MAKNTTRTAAPANEDKAGKFKRIGAKRLTKAVKAIKGLENLSGRGYEYTDAQVTAIRQHLTDAVNTCLQAFHNKGKATETSISL